MLMRAIAPLATVLRMQHVKYLHCVTNCTLIHQMQQRKACADIVAEYL